jgi:hypothetical protein
MVFANTPSCNFSYYEKVPRVETFFFFAEKMRVKPSIFYFYINIATQVMLLLHSLYSLI